MKNQFSIGIFGIIFDKQERVLLCHRRDHDLWNLPGGSLEQGESPWDGVKREVKEETGLEVEISKLVGIYSKPDRNEIVLSFICEVISGEIALNEEADRIEYFRADQLPSNLSSKQAERIKDAFTSSDEVILKVQTGKSSIDLLKEGKARRPAAAGG